MPDLRHQIIGCVEQTPFVDTHEHLIEERQRVDGVVHPKWFKSNDWSFLFQDYGAEDLLVCGMPQNDLQRFLCPNLKNEEKYSLLAPYWKRIKNTGYGLALRHTFQGIYGESDITSETSPRIAEKYHEFVKPGFYLDILKRSNIELCHVNSVQRTFMESATPNILGQDLSILGFCRCSAADFARIEEETGRYPSSLDEWLAIIDEYFFKYGTKAVAVKCQIAYTRALDFSPVTKSLAARLFPHQVDRTGARHSPGADDLKAIQDFLFHYCVSKAEEYGLPVKLHTGYLASVGVMQAGRVRNNAADLCRLLQDYPDVKFVLMHIGYPYENEFIALAKQYPNVFIDMCWAWMLNPAASTRFLTEFLVAVPSNKIFTFGGDLVAAEPIYGHAVLARRGIVEAVYQLVTTGWLAAEDMPALIEQIMRENAHQFFPHNPSGTHSLTPIR